MLGRPLPAAASPVEDRTRAGGRTEFKPTWGPWPSFSPARMGCRKPYQHQQGLLFYFLFRLSLQTRKKKKKGKKAKWLSEEALQIAEKRREVKSKGEKERYTHLNAEFQTIARRDKKAFSAINAKK